MAASPLLGGRDHLLSTSRPVGSQGRSNGSSLEGYLEHVLERFGWTSTVCASQSTAGTGVTDIRRVLPAARHHVLPLATEPDGRNINVGCGATDSRCCRATRVRLGSVVFDGDGDRMSACHAEGNAVDGDQTPSPCSHFI